MKKLFAARPPLKRISVLVFACLISAASWNTTLLAFEGCDGANINGCKGNGAQSKSSTDDANDASSRIIDQSTGALIQIIEDSEDERQAQQNEARRLEEERQLIESQEKQKQMNKAMQDDSLNPWANAPKFRRGASQNPQPTPAPPPGTKVSASKGTISAKDPGQDYTGKSCEYFTRPSDEAHLNYHSDGTVLSYGNRVYKCVDRRWVFLTTKDKYWASVKRLDASWLEGGTEE